MLLKAVMDIDPGDQMFWELGQLAFGLGLFDMTEILMIFNSRQFTPNQIDPKGLVACAVINFANWKHQSFEIEIPANLRRTAMQLERIYSAEIHKSLGELYLSKARKIISEKPAN